MDVMEWGCGQAFKRNLEESLKAGSPVRRSLSLSPRR